MKYPLGTAGVIAAALSNAVLAEEILTYQGDEIVVTATRFEEQRVVQPANVLTITKEDIAASAATTVPDLLRSAAGINVTSYYGDYSVNTDIDARGFGESGNSHLLVLLNGRRLNAIDSNAVDNWNALPINDIERVEIIRGSGTVLYGDNAMAGVVNIITRKSTAKQADVAAKAGSFGTYAAEASASGGEGATFHVFANSVTTDSYRRNNHVDITNLTGRTELPIRSGQGFIEFGVTRLASGLPGSLTQAQFNADPRASFSPNDFQKKQGYFIRPGVQMSLTPQAEFSAELGFDDSKATSFIQGWASFTDTDVQTLSFTPRLKVGHTFLGLASTTVGGLDFYDSHYSSNRGADPSGPITSVITMDQRSAAAYLQNSTSLSDKLVATVGARTQTVDQNISRTAVASLTNNRSKTACDLGLSYQATDALRLFGKTGTTFRFPKTDDLTTFVGLGVDLRPEYGKTSEVGAEWRTKASRLQVSLYDLRLTDEIAFNNTTFQNENLDKTVHRGLEADARQQLTRDLSLKGAYAYTDAHFADGPNVGKAIPLVPRDKASLSLIWRQNERVTLSGEVNSVGSRYFGGDYSNASPKLGGYRTVDFYAAWRGDAWTTKLAVKNLLNEKYAALAYAGTPNVFYPSDARGAYLTVQRTFR